jgi:hypothetical protein
MIKVQHRYQMWYHWKGGHGGGLAGVLVSSTLKIQELNSDPKTLQIPAPEKTGSPVVCFNCSVGGLCCEDTQICRAQGC